MAVLSIEQVLAAEAKQLHGDIEKTRKLAELAEGQQDQHKRKLLNEDRRAEHRSDAVEVKPRRDFYVLLNELNSAALCCSGGGIRSATFCLGIIQALAGYDLSKTASTKHTALPAQPAEPGTTAQASSEAIAPTPGVKQPIEVKNSALSRFHYLSTVSGGGYVGSWLSSWRRCNDFATVIGNLTDRPSGSDIEPPQISWLRAYSNYLTPRLGVTSADSWAAVAICIRNLILNWFVIIPIVCIALLLLKLIATISVLIAHTVNHPAVMIGIALAGAAFLVVAQAFTNSHRPPRRAAGVNTGEKIFLLRDLIWALASAILLTVFFSSRYFMTHFGAWAGVTGNWPSLDATLSQLGFDLKLKWLLLTAVAGMLLYSFGWIAAGRFGKGGDDFLSWAASGLIYGTVIGLGAYLFWWLGPYEATLDNIRCLLLSVILGVPWVIMAQLAAGIVFVGLTSTGNKADADREWLGRAGGWLTAGAIVWAIMAVLVFAGGYLVQYAADLGHLGLVKAGGVTGIISGLVTAFLGSSSKTSAKSSRGDQGGATTIVYNLALAVAGPVFAAILIIGLSAFLDHLLFADALAAKLQLIKDVTSTYPILLWLIIGLVITGAIAWIASRSVNVNRFSLHALYRNRLIRCYLGASNEKRAPDLFSGFDFNDNVCVHELWPPKPHGQTNSYSLFHVINIALNVVSTKRLAWQERKAESFTVTPKHCGSAFLGFRQSDVYGGQGGLSLGTAMAISGAAVSSNMGYHSSPSLSLLLTLFNVRLGWWLGNPGAAGEKTYEAEGPLFAARPLLTEAFGLTTDSSPYVYLSDGGHFENLGLYEMVRRRCRLIVLIDAGCDPDFAFEDLGNAVRKIYIDLGIRITFKDLGKLKNRPSTKSFSRAVRDAAALASLSAVGAIAKESNTATPGQTPYHAVGTIHYDEADCKKADDDSAPAEKGYIIYIKPAYHGAETSAGIRSYATANPEFPHETTADQWFTESQFESYRSLGLDIANEILHDGVILCPKTKLTLHAALSALPPTTR
jgi:hypothetical protein